MTKFKDCSSLHRLPLDNPSVTVAFKTTSHTLYLRFDSKDILVKASYLGPVDPWLGSLCFLAEGKRLDELLELHWKDWDQAFMEDQTYWDLKVEKSEQFFFSALELLKAGIDIYLGRDYLYKEADPLICRCFGVRENDVLTYIRNTDDPTPEGLATASKAGMGCRSCVPQLTKWLSILSPKREEHYYKEKPRAHWLLEIDHLLSGFPESQDWKMEVESFKGNQVKISFNKKVSQKEEEEVAARLQDFLAAALDPDLSFFLVRS